MEHNEPAKTFSEISFDGMNLYTEQIKPSNDGDNGSLKTTESDTKPSETPTEVQEVSKPENPKLDDEWVNAKENRKYKFDGNEWIPEANKVKIGDSEFTDIELLDALEDSQNKKKWQTENTKKSQELAETRKTVEPIVDFIKTLKGENEIIETLKTLLEDEGKTDILEKLNTVLDDNKIKAYKSPYLDEIETYKGQIAKIEEDKAFEIDREMVKKKYQIGDKKVDEVIGWANKRFDESGVTMTMEDALKSYDYENKLNTITELKKKLSANLPNIVDKTVGAKDVKMPQENKTPKDFKGIDLTGEKLWEEDTKEY